jgi:hypothetical protein
MTIRIGEADVAYKQLLENLRLTVAFTLPSARTHPLPKVAQHGDKALEERRTPQGYPHRHERHT